MAEERINKNDGENPTKSGAELTPEELDKVSGGARKEAESKARPRGEADEKASASEQRNKQS